MTDIDFSKVYSYSKIELFKKCPKQYFFNYLDPVIAPIKKQYLKPRDYKTKGQAVHGAITLFYHLPIEERNFKNLKNLLLQAWFSEVDPSKEPPLSFLGGFKNIEHERKTYQDCLILLKNFYELKDIKPSFFLLPSKDIKYSFDDYKELIKPLNNEISISGKFDRVDKLENGNLRIIDFKTGKNNQNYDQLEFYKLLAELNFNRKVEKVSFYYLTNKKIKSFDVSNVNLDEIKNKVLRKIDIIKRTKEFLPNPTKLCNHCDFQEICPVFKKNNV